MIVIVIMIMIIMILLLLLLLIIIMIMMIIMIAIPRGAGDTGQPHPQGPAATHNSGGRLCTLIGVPCRLSMLSTFSTSANVLF